MKRIILILPLVIVIAASNALCTAAVYFDDGVTHTINDTTYQNDWIGLDYYTTNDPGTRVDLVNDGIIRSSSTYNNSTFTISGGSVSESLGVFDNSTLTMTAGSIGYSIQAYNNSKINISGGLVGGRLSAGGDSTVTISGGSIGGELWASYDSIIYLDGTDFVVTDSDGKATSLSYGDKLSDFGTFVEQGGDDCYTGTIAGILADGSVLANEFDIYNTGFLEGTADIIITPEPTSLLLLGFGGLLLRRKNS